MGFSFVIIVPAWGERCVTQAVRYALPSIYAAMAQSSAARQAARFIIYTDQPDAFAMSGYDVEFRSVPAGETDHAALTAAHTEVLAHAAFASVVALFNADIVVSREAFGCAEHVFDRGDRKVIASVAPRTLVKGELPPIGASAGDLLQWAWRNRHSITEECVWGRGRTTFPNTLIFEDAAGVVLHCFHAHPFFVLKDRELQFQGTVDDDLLACYADDEIYYLRDAEIGFAEMSIDGFNAAQYGIGDLVTEDFIVQFGEKYLPSHIRNFKNGLRILGNGEVSAKVASAIADRMRR